jgi:hypothetical protein
LLFVGQNGIKFSIGRAVSSFNKRLPRSSPEDQAEIFFACGFDSIF